QGVKNPSVEWGDYDNDGDLDLLYCGEGLNNAAATYLYDNLGNNAFALSSATLPDVKFGSVDWGDYDNDGDLDILICGQDGSNNRITRVYKNDGNQTFNLISANLTGIERGEAQWVDYNSDGRLDIFLIGQDGPNSTDRTSALYTNDGNGNFVLETSLSGFIPDLNGGITGFARVQWADIVLESPGTNRTLEAIVTGESNSGPIFRIYQLTGATVNNTRSNAPQGLTATQSGTSVNLTWHAPNNINPFILSGQGYNLSIGTTPTNTVIKPGQADLITGFSRTTFEGSVRDTSWTLTNLIPGQTYYWRVQAIDQNQEGGNWSTTNSFTYVNPTATTSAFADSTSTDIGGIIELKFAAMDFGDFDQDGDMDMIVCGEEETFATPRTLYYSYDTGSGRFLPNDVGQSPFPQIDEGDIAVGDLDLDGSLDVVLGGLEGGTSVLEYFLNDQSGNFFNTPSLSGSFTEGIERGSIDLADFDNDGDLDVLITGSFSPSQATRIYLNQIVETGTLSFTDFSPAVGLDDLVNVFNSSDAEFGDFD
ncbi:MAG: FG-GAP-like repeat-containing protein, partial [Bacteroidota bacterium]